MASSSTAANFAIAEATDSAIATSDSTVVAEPIYAESLPVIDLRNLTQAEIFSLCRCNTATFDPINDDKVVLPTINQSVFNHSSGSRRQTYSRTRFGPTTSQPPLRRRTPSYLSELEKRENKNIISHFKKLFRVARDAIVNEDQLVPVRVDYSPNERVQIGPIKVELAIDPINAVPMKQKVSHRKKTTAAFPIALKIDDDLVPDRVDYSHTEPPMVEKINSTVPVTAKPIY